MDSLQIAGLFSKKVHEGERLKYVPGPYYTHPKAVSERQWDLPAKVVALLHDAVETHVKKVLGKSPAPADEERVIAEYLRYLGAHFRSKDSDISELIQEIDILTKRTKDIDYQEYIARIIRHAQQTGPLIAIMVKLADLEDNMLPERNPPVRSQNSKDIERLIRYDGAKQQIQNAFPDIELRPRHEDRPKTKDLSGHGRRTLADLKAKENAGARGATRRALRPGLKRLDKRPPKPRDP